MNEFILNEYFSYKPTVFDALFFPNQDNEIRIVNMLRTCKHSLDIAIFTFTNHKISNVVVEAFRRGIKIRLIADDVCCGIMGSDVYKLASMVNRIEQILSFLF